MVDKSPKRRWFQFRLRTLLVAILVLSLPLSWIAVRMERARRQSEAVEVIVEAGGEITYEPATPSAPDWACELFGEDFFVDVVEVTSLSGKFGDGEVACLGELAKLRSLSLYFTHVTDTGLEHLKRMGNLQELRLVGTEVTDTGLGHLNGLGSLQELYVVGTEITDTGLEHLKGMVNLQVLHLNGTEITDTGIEYLKGMGSLQKLYLENSQVTPEGVKKLQKALPNCKIEY